MSTAFDQFVKGVETGNLQKIEDATGDLWNQTFHSAPAKAQPKEAAAATAANTSHLPELQLTGVAHDAAHHAAPGAPQEPSQPGTHIEAAAAALAQPAHADALHQVENVVGTFFEGVKEKAEKDPLGLAKDAAESLAIGVVTGAAVAGAAALAVGAGIIAAPTVGTIALVGAGVTAVGYAGYGAYEAITHWDEITHDTAVVADPNAYSSKEVAQATRKVEDFGGASLDQTVRIAAGIPGAMIGSYAMSAAIAALAPAAAGSVATAEGALANVAPPAPEGALPTPDVVGAPAAPGIGGPTPDVVAPGTAAVIGAPTPDVLTPAAAAAPAPTPEIATHISAVTAPPSDVAPPVDAPAPVEATPLASVDLENPAANTSEPALRAALRGAVTNATSSDTPAVFKIDTRVPLTAADGSPSSLSQADVLYQELQAAAPDNHFVFSKTVASPGEPGYEEYPAPAVTQNGLLLSTKENGITLASNTTLPDGTNLPAGSKFSVGTTYDGAEVKSALAGGRVWATTPDGQTVMVADSGASVPVPADVMSTSEREMGQVVNMTNSKGIPNHILIRTDATATAPDGSKLLDAYPMSSDTLGAIYKPGVEPGTFTAAPKQSDHFLLPQNISVQAMTNYGGSTADGANGDYFMKSGFADAQAPTAKNYNGPAVDAKGAAEILRIRIAQGLASK